QACLGGGLACGLILGRQSALDDSAEGLDGAGGDDALGSAADAHEHVYSGAGAAGGDGSGDIAVGDELDAGSCGADLIDHLLMAGTVRSEEHTSELQSRFDLVCRLLLEKKKYQHLYIKHAMDYVQ